MKAERRDQKRNRAYAKTRRANNRKALEVLIQARLKRLENLLTPNKRGIENV